ncbi:MAG: hypothetical protein JWQ11_880, partial [Rhizobacter sp.]|nr:hypothetical protein [Rhizobacter sp.]
WLQGTIDGAPGPGRMRWLDAAGREMPVDGWRNPESRAIALWLGGDDDIELLIVFNAGDATQFDLPEDGADGWHSVFNTADAEAEPLRMPLTFKVAERSVRLLKRKGVQPAL